MSVTRLIAIATVLCALCMICMVGASFSIPDIGFPNMEAVSAPRLLPEGYVPTGPSSGTGYFTLSLSGNVYVDKMPVNGADVSVYVNGKLRGKTVAGDLYMFDVPGVMIGDTIEVHATFDGKTGSATEKVQFKNMNVNVYIKSGQSFIRRALDFLPTGSDLDESQQVPAGQVAASSTAQTPAQLSQMTANGAPVQSKGMGTTSDAGALSDQVMKQTGNALGLAFDTNNNAVLNSGKTPTTGTIVSPLGGKVDDSEVMDNIPGGVNPYPPESLMQGLR